MSDDPFADYRRGIEEGVMKSATPNAMLHCLKEIDRLRAMVADAILYGMTLESCDRCGGEILSIPRDNHPEGILWCAKCAEIETGIES